MVRRYTRTFHNLSLIVNPENTGSTLLALVISNVEKLLPGTLASYVSVRHRSKPILRLTKISFITKKCESLAITSSCRDLWHLAISISYNLPLYLFLSVQSRYHDCCLLYLYCSSFAQTFAKISTLNDPGFPFPLQLLTYLCQI